jgi:hypothetical protein
MTGLPHHRRAIFGRTHDRRWEPADMDPIRRYRRLTIGDRIAGVVLAVVIGIAGAGLLVHWLAR